jgi:hypothetical protein
MKTLRSLTRLLVAASVIIFTTNQAEAVTYVTDTGGYAYDESRAATNIAPAVALGTVVLVGIIALGVQNSHHHSTHSHSSSSFFHGGTTTSFTSGTTTSFTSGTTTSF